MVFPLSLVEMALCLAVGYLIGSVPTPYIIVRAASGVDLREIRTGNVGVMNSGSVLGRRGLLVVMLAELVKGMLAAVAGAWIGGTPGAWLGTIAAVIGANWSMWLGWSGGRGNTAFGGGILLTAPQLLLSIVLVWIVGRVTLQSSFRATRLNIYTLPLQIAAWSWWQQPREYLAFYVVTGLVPTAVFLSRHRRETDDHMAFRADEARQGEGGPSRP